MHKWSVGTAVLASLLFRPALAGAQANDCRTPVPLFLNERVEVTAPAAAQVFFRFPAVQGRSYAISAWAPFTQGGADGGDVLDLDVFIGDGSCTTVPAGVSKEQFDPVLTGSQLHSGAQLSLVAPSKQLITVMLSNPKPSAYAAHVVVAETTLFSPWWFVGGSNQAYVEVTNGMNAATSALVRLRRADGDLCGETQVALASHGNAAIEVRTVGTCGVDSVSGSAEVAYVGTPGGVVANATTIDVVNGTSFDAPFSPRMVASIAGR